MIVEGIIGWAFSIIDMLFTSLSGLQFYTLPANLMAVLVDFMKYSAWVIGSDLVGLVLTTIVWWLGTKLILGIILFAYRLLPLT